MTDLDSKASQLYILLLTKGKRRDLAKLPFFTKLSLKRAAKEAAGEGIKMTVGTRAMM